MLLSDKPGEKVGCHSLQARWREISLAVDLIKILLTTACFPDTRVSIIGKLKSIFASQGIPEELLQKMGALFQRFHGKILFPKHYLPAFNIPKANASAERDIHSSIKIAWQDEPCLAV